MSLVQRLVIALILVPVAIVLVALAVANRAPVAFTFDPFRPGNPALTIDLPFFVYLFAAIGIGVLLGSFATWWKQGRYRKMARERTREVNQLRSAEKPAPGTALTAPNA